MLVRRVVVGGAARRLGAAFQRAFVRCTSTPPQPLLTRELRPVDIQSHADRSKVPLKNLKFDAGDTPRASEPGGRWRPSARLIKTLLAIGTGATIAVVGKNVMKETIQSVGAAEDLRAVSHIDVSVIPIGDSRTLAVIHRPVLVWRLSPDFYKVFDPHCPACRCIVMHTDDVKTTPKGFRCPCCVAEYDGAGVGIASRGLGRTLKEIPFKMISPGKVIVLAFDDILPGPPQ